MQFMDIFQHLLINQILTTVKDATQATECALTRHQVETENRIFAISKNGVLELLHTDKVAVGDTLQLICDSNNIVAALCQADGTFNVPIPTLNCARPIKASVKLGFDAQCNGNTYHVGYDINGRFLELYRSCYNQKGVKAIMSKHNSVPYALVTSRPDATFTTDGVIRGADAATFDSKNVYARFEALLGPQQTYITSPTSNVIHRGHLTPSGDFLFLNNMRATFKYINAIPQFGSINIGNWKSIENWVRGLNKMVSVTTGALDEVLELKDKNGNFVKMYLESNDRNPIPKWIFKVVNDGSSSITFLTYNNIFDNNRPTPPASCRQTACPITLQNNKNSGFTFCCS